MATQSPIRTSYFVGFNGHRYHFQGNSMGDPSVPSDDFATKEEAQKAAHRWSNTNPPLSVYRVEIYSEE